MKHSVRKVQELHVLLVSAKDVCEAQEQLPRSARDGSLYDLHVRSV